MDRFTPLAEILRPPPREPEMPTLPPAAAETFAVAERVATVIPEQGVLEAQDRFCNGIALARLAAIEAFERSSRRTLETLARDVLAREFALADADLETLVRRAREAFASEEPVRIVVAPRCAERLTCDLPLRSDPSLDDGDLVLEVRDGVLDMRVAVRLKHALDEATT